MSPTAIPLEAPVQHVRNALQLLGELASLLEDGNALAAQDLVAPTEARLWEAVHQLDAVAPALEPLLQALYDVGVRRGCWLLEGQRSPERVHEAAQLAIELERAKAAVRALLLGAPRIAPTGKAHHRRPPRAAERPA